MNRNNASAAAAGISQEVLHLVKAQRRVRGTVATVKQGECKIESSYGVFPFDPRSVKANKNHPDRKPEAGDPCEFRLSHHIPPTAVSIRVAVPKVKKVESIETSTPIDDTYLKRLAGCLEEHCSHVAPLVAKLEADDLKLSFTLHYLIVKMMDEVEGSRALSIPTRQSVLRDFYTYVDGDAALPCDVSSLAVFKQFKLITAGLDSLCPAVKKIIVAAVQVRGEGLAGFFGKRDCFVAGPHGLQHGVGRPGSRDSVKAH
eukprot:TRINITY_DN2253_c0_g1_i1.p2 TRINITY_DN2253_c0_g1~~TRINITY_DN2253_c0_g1_i1.p2  ORF type:complete len:258 (+),score=33.66 TRINITY_DN2253_c0_g1_i1:48-821(+)